MLQGRQFLMLVGFKCDQPSGRIWRANVSNEFDLESFPSRRSSILNRLVRLPLRFYIPKEAKAPTVS